MRTAIDTNIFSSLWANEPMAVAVQQTLFRAMLDGPLSVCGIVYAETLANRNVSEQLVDETFSATQIRIDIALSLQAWRDAGLRFRKFTERRRRSGHERERRLLADFLIGSHAVHHADRLLTLDPRRYRSYFPELELMPIAK